MSEPTDPRQKAQAAARPPLPRRFYKEASVEPSPGGFAISLDGRPVRTPRRNLIEVPERALAEAIAEEWRRQQTEIDPATMPLTRLVNAALDGVAGQETAVRADILKYAGTDLLCYRAGHPAALAERQSAGWDPVLVWARERLAADLQTAQGIVHVAQPADALASLAAVLEALPALTLAALHSATTLTGSAILALAVQHGRLSPQEAWRLAYIDEDYQIEQWGWDAEANAARERKWSQMQAAALVLSSGRG